MKLTGHIRNSLTRRASLPTSKMEKEDFAKIACECRLTYGKVTNNFTLPDYYDFSKPMNFVNEPGEREVVGEIPTGMIFVFEIS